MLDMRIAVASFYFSTFRAFHRERIHTKVAQRISMTAVQDLDVVQHACVIQCLMQHLTGCHIVSCAMWAACIPRCKNVMRIVMGTSKRCHKLQYMIELRPTKLEVFGLVEILLKRQANLFD